MAGSIVVAVRRAVVDGLAALAALDGVQVTYGWPGDDRRQRERIFTNRPRGDHEPASLRPGRTYRNEEVEFDIVVHVEGVGKTSEETDDRALVLGTAVEEFIADNRSLIAVDGFNWITVRRFELNNLYNDRGALSELVYTVRYNARLT